MSKGVGECDRPLVAGSAGGGGGGGGLGGADGSWRVLLDDACDDDDERVVLVVVGCFLLGADLGRTFTTPLMVDCRWE